MHTSLALRWGNGEGWKQKRKLRLSRAPQAGGATDQALAAGHGPPPVTSPLPLWELTSPCDYRQLGWPSGPTACRRTAGAQGGLGTRVHVEQPTGWLQVESEVPGEGTVQAINQPFGRKTPVFVDNGGLVGHARRRAGAEVRW